MSKRNRKSKGTQFNNDADDFLDEGLDAWDQEPTTGRQPTQPQEQDRGRSKEPVVKRQQPQARRSQPDKVQQVEAQLSKSSAQHQPARVRKIARKRRRSWPTRILAGVACLLLLVLVLPTIVAKTPLSSWAVRRAIADLPIDAKFEAVRLNWWSSPVVSKLIITDSQANPLVECDHVAIDRSLWQLAFNPSQLGTIRLSQPQLWLQVRADGSNVEDVLAAMPSTDDDSQSPIPSMQLQIEHGRVHLSSDDSTLKTWQLNGISGSATLGSVETIAAKFDAVLSAAGTEPAPEGNAPRDEESHGRIALNVVNTNFDARADGETMKQESRAAEAINSPTDTTLAVTLALQDCDLGPAQHAAFRAGRQLSITGRISGETDIQIVATKPSHGKNDTAMAWSVKRLTSTLDIGAFRARDKGWERDELQLEAARLQVVAQAHDDRIVVEHCVFDSPLGTTRLTGEFSATDLADVTASLQALSRQPLECAGNVQLAELARQLPNVLSLREDLKLTTGEIRWQVANQLDTASGGSRLVGEIATVDLAGVRDGRRIELRDPLKVEFEVTQQAEGQRLTAERLTVASSFITASGRGDLQQGGLRWRADGQRLVAELGQFFDLSDIQVSGKFDGLVEWRTDGDQWRVNGEADGQGLALTLPGRSTLDERQVSLTLGAEGRIKDLKLDVLQTAQFELTLGDDRASANLTRAVPNPTTTSQWPIAFDAKGDLGRWTRRLQWATTTPMPAVAGQFSGSGSLALASPSIAVDRFKISTRNVRVDTGDGQVFAEPALEMSATGAFDFATRQLTCDVATIATTSLSVKADGVTWPIVAESTSASRLHIRGNVARLFKRFAPGATSYPTGQLLSQVTVLPQGGKVTFESSSTVEQFQWLTVNQSPRRESRPTLLWQEPRVALDVAGHWSPMAGNLTVSSSQFTTDAIAIQLAGTVQDLTGALRTDMRGQTRIDHDRLSSRLRPLLGDEVRLIGVSEEPFAIQGPLRASSATAYVSRSGEANRTLPGGRARPASHRDASANTSAAWIPADLQAQFGFGWENANAYGLAIGATTVDAKVEQRTLLTRPILMDVAGGKLRLVPRIRLSPPWIATLEPGVVVDHVAVTPQMCEQWLKYVAPLVADATAAEGQFSVRVANAEIPLLATQRANIEGSLAIHNAKVGPGPAARELLTLAQQIRSLLDPGRGQSQWLDTDQNWILFPEQAASFRVANGQVAHNNLTMVVGGVELKTRGAIGFDQRMDLVAEIQIQEAWVANNRWLANMKGQSIEIPIRGTVDRPQVDRSVMQRLAERAAQSAAKNMLQNEVQKQLKGLFK